MANLPKTSDLNGQPTEPKVDDVAALLSPPPDLSNRLSDSAKTYKAVIAGATNILTKSSVDLDAFRSADPDDKSSGIRDMIVTIKSDFTRFADRETDLCKNLIAYGQLLNTLVSKVDTSVLAIALGGRLDTFRKAMNDDSQDRATRAAKILKNVDDLLSRLADASAAIDLLSRQASAMEEELRHQNVGSRLIDALKKLFHLEDDQDGALTQISIIVGIAVEYLRGDFDQLSKDKKAMQSFIDKVNALQSGLAKVKASMLAMANGMKSSVDANASLVAVWDVLSKNMATVKSQEKTMISVEDQNKIMLSWEVAKTAANEAIAAITGGTSAVVSSLVSQGTASGITASSITYPASTAEVQLFKLAGNVGVDHMLVEPEKFSTLSRLSAMPEVMDSQSARTFSLAAAAPMEASDDDKKKAAEELMKKLGPPAIDSVKTQLESLAGDCKQVISTFTSLLEIPFLQNLSILNPFKDATHPSEPDNLNMREVVTRYKDQYVSLQDDTKTTAKSLISYSALQLLLLPRVELDPAKSANPGEGKISVDTYYLACFNAITGYADKATDLRKRHANFLSQWTLAQTNIIQKIAECKKTAEQLKTQIQEKKDEYKNKTIIGVLEILGGVACFALGFFVPFLAPVAWGAGVALIGVGIKELIDRGILDDAINELTNKFNAANDAAAKLEQLKAPFATVLTKVENLVGIWDGIEQAMINIKTMVSTLKDIPAGTVETLWAALLPQNTKDWQTVKDLITQYVDAIK